MAELQPNIVFYSRHFVRHLGICNRICVELLELMFGVNTHNSVKKRSLHINKWLSYGHIVFHGRHFVRHLGICHLICVKLFQVMSGVIPSNLKKTTSLSQNVVLSFTNAAYTHTHSHTHTHTQTHTHTHDDSIRRNAMRCILPKNA